MIEWLPATREDVASVALPPESVPVPSDVAPSKNSTVPVGVPAPGADALTVAVKVTDSPKFDGLLFDATDVDVLALFTTCVSVEELLVLKFASALYTAVIE